MCLSLTTPNFVLDPSSNKATRCLPGNKCLQDDKKQQANFSNKSSSGTIPVEKTDHHEQQTDKSNSFLIDDYVHNINKKPVSGKGKGKWGMGEVEKGVGGDWGDAVGNEGGSNGGVNSGGDWSGGEGSGGSSIGSVNSGGGWGGGESSGGGFVGGGGSGGSLNSGKGSGGGWGGALDSGWGGGGGNAGGWGDGGGYSGGWNGDGGSAGGWVDGEDYSGSWNVGRGNGRGWNGREGGGGNLGGAEGSGGAWGNGEDSRGGWGGDKGNERGFNSVGDNGGGFGSGGFGGEGWLGAGSDRDGEWGSGNGRGSGRGRGGGSGKNDGRSSGRNIVHGALKKRVWNGARKREGSENIFGGWRLGRYKVDGTTEGQRGLFGIEFNYENFLSEVIGEPATNTADSISQLMKLAELLSYMNEVEGATRKEEKQLFKQLRITVNNILSRMTGPGKRKIEISKLFNAVMFGIESKSQEATIERLELLTSILEMSRENKDQIEPNVRSMKNRDFMNNLIDVLIERMQEVSEVPIIDPLITKIFYEIMRLMGVSVKEIPPRKMQEMMNELLIMISKDFLENDNVEDVKKEVYDMLEFMAASKNESDDRKFICIFFPNQNK